MADKQRQEIALIGKQHQEITDLKRTVARLESDASSVQQRINRAVRDLDHLANVAAKANNIPLYQEIQETQSRLRG